ncbi:hypothetical protein AB0D11_24820 [Streptomyces monashensis]
MAERNGRPYRLLLVIASAPALCAAPVPALAEAAPPPTPVTVHASPADV